MTIARIVVIGVLVPILCLTAAAQGSFGPSLPDYKGPIIGAAIGIGAAAGVGIYLVHRSHTSLSGCVVQEDRRLSLKANNGKSYELLNSPSAVKAGERLSLRGHKTKTASGAAFQVSKISRDHGACHL